ncbi:MAG: RraA family protein [Deltaproteobacteria bacterium]|nr:RraA family protein [Deltaproteobacteria bacterium]MBM4296817.1 RraA family protein [Deltaproteobacteria bacterium]
MAREAIIERLLKLDTCSVSDGMDSLGVKGATWGVRPQWQCPRIAGRAVTMKIKPQGLQQPTQHLGTTAIEVASPGDIIVIDNGGQPQFSCWGGLLSLSAKLKGVSGVVIDGACRDIDEARDLAFPVYARGVVPMTARGRVMQESFNQEIEFAGVQCHPGDLVLADGSGIIIIPREKENEILVAAEAVFAKEQEMAAGIRKGYSGLEMLEKLGYEQMLNKKS